MVHTHAARTRTRRMASYDGYHLGSCCIDTSPIIDSGLLDSLTVGALMINWQDAVQTKWARGLGLVPATGWAWQSQLR